MIINIHRINPINCGDMASSPLNYFKLPPCQKKCIVTFINEPNQLENRFTLFGGGGLFYDDWHKFLETYASIKKRKSVVWGAGLNYHGKKNNNHYPEFIKKFDLVGVRDWIEGLRWVPCASCMDASFDKKYITDKEIVVFEHIENTINTNLPKFTNNQTIENAIAFLGSSKCVITNSYHGVYWSTLLGKKVIAIPVENSSRFFFFKHPPLIKQELSTDFSQVKKYPNALKECREANMSFYQDFLKIYRKQKGELLL